MRKTNPVALALQAAEKVAQVRQERPWAFNHTLVRRTLLPLWARTWWNIGLAALVLLVGALQVGDHKIKAKSWDWIHNERLQLVCVLVPLLLVFLDSCRRAVLRARAGRAEDVKMKLHKHLGTTAATVSEVLEVPIGDVGVGLYLPAHRWLRPRFQLQRPLRVRLIEKLSDSLVTFFPGKGAVGKCWADKIAVHHPWVGLNHRYATSHPTAERWAKMPAQSTRDFEREEWCRMVGRYSEVMAVPVIAADDVRAVLAVDLRWDGSREQPDKLLSDRVLRETIAAAAMLLAKDLM